MVTSKLNLPMPFNSIPATTIHPSSIPKHSTPTPLFISPISPISPKSTSPYFYTQSYPHPYTYTSSPESQSQPPAQTPTQIHPSHSLKRSHSSISLSYINSSYSHPKRIRTDEKEQNQFPTLPSSGRSKHLKSDNFTYEEDIQGEEDNHTIEDEETAGLRKDIEEYGRLLLHMAEIIEGALGEVG